MSEPDRPATVKPDNLTPSDTGSVASEEQSTSSLQGIHRSLPMRMAVIGHHLPRQCDLGNAITVEYSFIFTIHGETLAACQHE